MTQTVTALAARERDEPPAGHLVSLDRARAEGGSEPIRVLIAEGQGLVRAGFRALLEQQDGMCVVAEAATGEDAVAAALRIHPDVVLIDLGLPGLDGLDATRRILAETAPGATRVVMLMTTESD
jgi:DNA-binding NarL/FixJ family response regulator